ncbi:MAG: hypothetical protein ABGX04_16435 [Myxococcales bacterium]
MVDLQQDDDLHPASPRIRDTFVELAQNALIPAVERHGVRLVGVANVKGQAGAFGGSFRSANFESRSGHRSISPPLLGNELFAKAGRSEQLRVRDLDHDLTAESLIHRRLNRRHAAHAEFTLDDVSVGQRLPNSIPIASCRTDPCCLR